MARILELPEELFQKLQHVAKSEGVTPVEWLETTIARHAPEDSPPPTAQTLAEALASFIGVVDSSTVTPDPRYRSDFGDLVDEKMAEQGFKRPRWER